jgi:SAM-dependent methyltransferase
VIDVYEHRIGHACRAVASHLPALIKTFPHSGGTVLDNACGTGAASEEFLKKHPTAEIFAADIVPPMVQAFKTLVAMKPELQDQVKEVRLEDAQSLSFADDTFDASITNFGIFFFPDPGAGARQIYRTLKPGGTAVVTVWKTFGFKPILWEIQGQVKPEIPLTELPLMEPWCESGLLVRTLEGAGFRQVDVSVVKEGLWGKDKEDFKLVLLKNLSAMTARNWTEEERAKLPSLISRVVDEQQDRFCISDGEKLGCTMEAWVAVAMK